MCLISFPGSGGYIFLFICPQTRGNLPTEKATRNVGPEFSESVASHATGHTKQTADERIIKRSLAFHSPRVREYVVAHYSAVTGIRRPQPAISASSYERHLDYVPEALPEGLPFRTEIPRVFSPCGAETNLDRVACRDSGKAHAIALAEPLPGGPVFRWIVKSCAPARRYDATG